MVMLVRTLAAVAAGTVLATNAFAQNAREVPQNNVAEGCGLTSVIPVTGTEPPAKIVIYPPLPGPLSSRGVAIIQYCTQNLHLVPVFGENALAASPRVGHIHVRVDDAPYVWADASGNPIILMGLLPGTHKVQIDLEDANHHALDHGMVSFVVPAGTATE